MKLTIEIREVEKVEIVLPDGTIARWSLSNANEITIDRLTDAIEAIIGPADLIIT
jgi:hypothetical protein